MTHSTRERFSAARNPLDVIASAHQLQEQLCDALERIADGLPDEADRRLCAQSAATLSDDIPLHHRDEEEGLFPLLRQRALPEDQIGETLDRLASEHAADTDFATEIAEALEGLARGEKHSNPDMVGYMLRGFFERYRRHVRWENALIMPVARARLGSDDLEALSQIMARNRGGQS